MNRIRMNRPAICWFLAAGAACWPPMAGLSAVKAKVEGRVLDAATGRGLVGANVVVRGTFFGAVTDGSGVFTVDGLPEGAVVLVATMMGFERQASDTVRARAGETTAVEFRLKPSLLHDPGMVVTASKRHQALEDAPTTVDVVSREDIEARSATTLDQAIQQTSGLGIIDGQIDLRGSSGFNWSAGSRVLLMVDGHPLINGDTGGINWDAIPLEQVERVEVVKGAGSALYGSNALAGMVNVITRDPSPVPETRVRATYGFFDAPAYDSWRWTDRFLTVRLFEQNRLDFKNALAFDGLDVSHSRSFGPVGVLVSGGRKRSTGFSQNGRYERWNALAKVKAALPGRRTLTLSAGWTDNWHEDVIQWLSQSRPLEVPPSERGNEITYAKANANATYRRVVNPVLAYTVKANWYRTEWRNFFSDNEDYALTHKFGAEAQADLVWRKQVLTVGAEAAFDRVTSAIYGDPTTMDLGLYAENETKFAQQWTLTLGTRFDAHRVTDLYSDAEVNPRFGLVFRPSEGSSLRLSAGHGFRAPSIAEMFADIVVSGVRVVKNLDLREAERAWSFELGAGQALSFEGFAERLTVPAMLRPVQWAVRALDPVLGLDAALFLSRYRNMIDVDFNPEVMAFQFMNMGRARTRGAELRLKGSFLGGFLSGQAGYTFLDARDLDDGTVLHYRSKHRLVTGGEIRRGRFALGLDYRYASRIESVANLYTADQRVPMHVMDGRILCDLGSGPLGSLDLAIEVRNLRNYHYSLRQRLLEPVRHVVFTLRAAR